MLKGRRELKLIFKMIPYFGDSGELVGFLRREAQKVPEVLAL